MTVKGNRLKILMGVLNEGQPTHFTVDEDISGIFNLACLILKGQLTYMVNTVNK